MHFKKQAQVEALLFDKALIKVPAEYSNYSNVFLAKNAIELPKNIRINEHIIELKKGKQLPFKPIYSLGLIELEIWKTYIKTNLVNGFIWPFKFPIRVSILFDKKLNENLHLCVDYWSLNNITIINQYSLSLIGKLLDQLS